MTSKRRPNNIAIPRQVAMYLSRTLTKHSLQEIGDAFGGRDHGTVIHACKAVDNMMEQDATMRGSVEVPQERSSRAEKEKLGLGKDEVPAEDEAAPPGSGVIVSVDKVSLNPNAMASGTMTFPDGVTGRWMVDLQGRPGIVEVSKPGYRPSPEYAQAFMQELSLALQGV
jgi:hypothetical protein